MRKIWARIRRIIIFLLSPISPRLCDRLMYLHRFHRRAELENPKTLNEKILWLKQNVYNSDPLVMKCADKYAVREYVTEKGCGDSLNELYHVWDRPEDIDWSSLPERFALKLNHGCGFNYICADKSSADADEFFAMLRKWANTEYWRFYAELQYRKIEKKIICEKYLGTDEVLPTDYKVYCFNGEPKYIMACEDRAAGETHFFFFDNEWKFCPITHDGLMEKEDFTLPRPKHFEKMLDYAAKLAEPFPFVRVDFYDVANELVFGELTFTPSAGLDTNRLPETELLFGNLLKLPVDGENDI